MKDFLIRFVTVFAITFVVNAIVVYVWNLVQHGEGTFNWGLSLTLAVILGIILPITRTLKSKEKI